MRQEHSNGTQQPLLDSIAANHDHASSSKHSSNGGPHNRTSQETLRREAAPSDTLAPSKSHKAAPIQIVPQAGASLPTENGGSACSASEHIEASGSRSRGNSPVPSANSRRTRESSVDDDEDVWEDEEESVLMDEHGDVIYGGPDHEDSISDFSDEADEDDSNQHRRAYREATQQYRKSRRALLLSGMSSFASSPSSDDLSPTPTMRQQTSASLSSSRSAPGSPGPEHESYYQVHSAEPVDSADTSGRTNGIKYDLESTKEAEPNGISPDGQLVSPITIKLEQQDDHGFSDEHQSPPTPRALSFGSNTLESSSPRLTIASPSDGFTRPPNASRGPSFLARAEPSTPIVANRLAESRSAAPADGHSQQNLAPSPVIFDGEHELTEAYMTPRLSISMLHDEQKLNPPPFILPEPIADAGTKQEREHKPIATAVASRPDRTPFSLWDYLKEEVLATDFDATQEMKWERVTNFISIPFWMEKIILFGFVVCLDSFLYTFTILPLRFFVAVWTWVGNTARWLLGGQRRYLHASHKCDILKMLLIVLSCWILSRITDASKMYHSVRGQDVVKLSVIFNVLEIADRLCCSFGQDLLDSLFSRSTLARRKNGRQPYLRPIGFFCLSLAYVLAHTLVLFYQLVTLNVAINSYDNALLTLLLSNQFVEIKSSVFKKFEKENVFQMTCADIVERFQLTLMLSAIGLRNLIELSGGSLEPSSSPLPASFTVFPSLSLLETVLTPVCIVLASECIVDWLKHAFITKFNHIRPAVYGRFMDVLCRDLVVGGPGIKDNSRKHTFVDQSPIISRRLGFAALPLACLLVRLILQIIGMIGDTSHIDECIAPISPRISESSWIGTVARKLGAVDINNEWVRAVDLFVRGSAWALLAIIAWGFLVAIKLLLGTNLVSFASHRYATMHERENEESLNSRDRAPIGTNKDERTYDKSLGQFIDKPDDDAIHIKLDGTHVLPAAKDRKEKGDGGGGGGGKAKKETSLMEVSRYNMVRSRIW